MLGAVSLSKHKAKRNPVETLIGLARFTSAVLAGVGFPLVAWLAIDGGLPLHTGPVTASNGSSSPTTPAPTFPWQSDPLPPASATPAPTPRAKDQTRIEFNHKGYYTVKLNPTLTNLELLWRDGQKRYGTLGAVEEALTAQGKRFLFATNAGMFHPDMRPVGLHIESGQELVPVDAQTEPPGNFYMKPNGVFMLRADRTPAIMTTHHFQKERPAHLRIATQSGPMLLIEGKHHPAFVQGSKHQTIRSGVGIADDGEVVFALSAEPVTLYEFASLFRDHFGCQNALYLDGAISALHAPHLGHSQPSGDFAGILVASE